MCTNISMMYATNADDAFWQRDRVNFNLGGFLPGRNTKIRIDSKALGAGTQISAEDDLGMEKKTTASRLDFHFRFNQHHRLDSTYYDLTRKSSNLIDKTIQYGDEIFVINTTIDSDFNFKVLKLAYTYSFVSNSTLDLGVSAGLFIQDYEITLKQTGTGGVEEKADLVAPLPVIGLRGTWAISHQWWLRSSAELFAIEYDHYKGRLADIIVSIEHNTFRNVGFGIGYNYTRFKLMSDDDEFLGELKINYSGLMIYTKMHF
ncbi:MAG: hypothetical protein ACN4GM_08535 [Gammaproteobacteria bacterium]